MVANVQSGRRTRLPPSSRDKMRGPVCIVRIGPDFPGAELSAQVGAQEREETRNRATSIARGSGDESRCDIST